MSNRSKKQEDILKNIKDAGMTQEQFAEVCGVNPRTVRRWLQPGNEAPDMAHKLSFSLGII